MIKYFLFLLLLISLKPIAQTLQLDSNRLKHTFLTSLNSSLAFGEFKNFDNPNTVTKFKQLEITLAPKLGIFVNRYLVLGMQWRYGWYMSNFNRSFPNSSAGGPFLEYYFTQWKMYKWNTIKFKRKVKGYLHPYMNLGYNFKNFYNGIDSFGNKGAIFNNRQNNQSISGLIGLNFGTKTLVNFNIALGVQYSKLPNILLQNTKLVRLTPTSELGVVVYFSKKRKG
jgi:hypothetical protein